MKYDFEEYHKIENSKFVDKLVSYKDGENREWVVLEKVHGANFSFYCDGETIQCSKRGALLKENEKFFGFQQVRDKYRRNVFELFHKLKSIVEEERKAKINFITIFGELFGGFYPHPSILDLGFTPVQREIYYHHQIDFYAFDIRVHLGGDLFWLNYDLCVKLFSESGFFYAEPLYRGTLEKCLLYNYKMNSTIPARIGLPPLAKNICEGVVVKSVDPLISKNRRAIFKLKNPNFEEVNPRHQTILDKMKPDKVNALAVINEELNHYINHNRVVSLKSKIGEFDKEKLEEVTNLLWEDVITDFAKNFPDSWKNVQEHHERIEKNMKNKITIFVLDWLVRS